MIPPTQLFPLPGYKDNSLIRELHISNDDGGTEPCYLIINENMDSDIENDIKIIWDIYTLSQMKL